MIAAILLAAGTSSRTGKKHKLLLPYKKKSIVAHSINNLLNSNVDRIIVIVGKAQHEVKKHIAQHKKIKIYYNQSYRSGMASSIKIGMKHLPRKTKSFFITLADMPNLESKYFNTMIKVSKNNSNIPIVTYFQKKQVNPVLFPYSFKKKLMALQGDRGAKLILQKEKIKKINIKKFNLIKDFDTLKDFKQ